MGGHRGEGPVVPEQAILGSEAAGRAQSARLETLRDQDWRRAMPRRPVGARHVALAAAPIAALILYVAWRLGHRELHVVFFSVLVWVGLFVLVGELLRAR